MNENPLEDLLLDAEEVDKAKLASVLKNILGIDKKTNRVVFKPEYDLLNAKQKIVAFLLGKKVAKLLGRSEREDIAPKDIHGETGLPLGTIHPSLISLRDRRFISQTSDGEYYVSPHQINNCIALLEGREK